jgi:hypothetical protein
VSVAMVRRCEGKLTTRHSAGSTPVTPSWALSGLAQLLPRPTFPLPAEMASGPGAKEMVEQSVATGLC